MRSWLPSPASFAAPRSRRLGIEEWLALPEDEPGELVDGYLTGEEVPDPIHELAVTWLITLFRAWLGQRGGFVFGSELKLVVSPTRGRKPDISVYLPERLPPPSRGALHEPPDIRPASSRLASCCRAGRSTTSRSGASAATYGADSTRGCSTLDEAFFRSPRLLC